MRLDATRLVIIMVCGLLMYKSALAYIRAPACEQLTTLLQQQTASIPLSSFNCLSAAAVLSRVIVIGAVHYRSNSMLPLVNGTECMPNTDMVIPCTRLSVIQK